MLKPLQNKKGQKNLGYPKKAVFFLIKGLFFSRVPQVFFVFLILKRLYIGFYPTTYCRHTNQARMEWQNIGQDRKNSTLVSVNMTIVAHDAKFWPEIEFVKE